VVQISPWEERNFDKFMLEVLNQEFVGYSLKKYLEYGASI
jgi:hypothetical protein